MFPNNTKSEQEAVRVIKQVRGGGGGVSLASMGKAGEN